jgi:hypothetical protein
MRFLDRYCLRGGFAWGLLIAVSSLALAASGSDGGRSSASPGAEDYGNFWLIVFGVIAALAGVSVIWSNLRRQPPVERSIKEAVAEAEGRLHEEQEAMEVRCKERIEGAELRMQAQLESADNRLSAEVGKLRSYGAQSTREIHEKIDHGNARIADRLDKMNASMNAGFQDIHRSLGQMEGLHHHGGER